MEELEYIEDEKIVEENAEMESFKAPLVYVYDKNTKEFLYSKQAEKDNAESLAQGKFIPLVNAYETLLEVPQVGANEIGVTQVAVYSSHYEDIEEKIIDEEENEIINSKRIKVEEWIIESDYRKNFMLVDENLNVSEIKQIGDVEGIKVTKELGEEIKENPSYFKIIDNEVVKKSDEEIEKEKMIKERNRLDFLSLTAADVERAIYKVKGLDFEDLVELVKKDSSIDIKELKIELRANNFYRGNPYVNKIGEFLGFSQNQLDKFFESGDFNVLEFEG